MSKSQRALVARRLLEDEDLQALFAEIRDDATRIFLNASASAADLEAAHFKVRAVETVLNALRERLTDKAIEEKRQHRGND
jgi:hypothetical protein